MAASSLESLEIQRYISDGPQCVNVYFVDGKDATAQNLDTNKFNPQTTEFLFGPEDQIIGYKAPVVSIHFAPSTLFGLVRTSWEGTLLEALSGPKRKNEETDAIPMTDLQGLVHRYMASIPDAEEPDLEERRVRAKLNDGSAAPPESIPSVETNPAKPFDSQPLYTTSVEEFVKQLKNESNFDPIELGGVIEDEYERNGRHYATLKFHPRAHDTTLSKEKALQSFFRRITLVTPLVIEDAQQIERTDDRWWLFVTFEKTSWSVVAFTTVYTFYCHPHSIRARVSQFGVLPHHQRHGHGARLYACVMAVLRGNGLARGVSGGGAVWSEFWEMPVRDVGVELPSDAFIDIRDKADALFVLAGDEQARALVRVVDDAVVEKVREYAKLTPKQARRMCETIVLKNLLAKLCPNVLEALQVLTNPRKKHAFDAELVKRVRKEWLEWRRWLKVRVWKMNKDVLSEMMTFERKQKLEEVVNGLQQDYVDIIVKL